MALNTGQDLSNPGLCGICTEVVNDLIKPMRGICAAVVSDLIKLVGESKRNQRLNSQNYRIGHNRHFTSSSETCATFGWLQEGWQQTADGWYQVSRRI